MQTGRPSIRISVQNQTLELHDGDGVLSSYPVSTSRFGVGSEIGSFKTPLGRFRIAEKIGEGLPHGTIFKNRLPVGPTEAPQSTDDLILSRILWLEGLEEHNSNTRDRYIYIHGTKHEDKIGSPASYGCIRMKSVDLIELFERVPLGTEVVIAS
jgi:lipoprotein-anchoring transpeptidase ErfK/SrfK